MSVTAAAAASDHLALFPIPADPPPAQIQAKALNSLRFRLTLNTIRTALRGSQLRIVMIAACSALFWTGLFLLFFEGFNFLSQYLGLTNEIVEYIFGMFFLSLLVMLLFSTGIILYTGLFESREAAFLLTLPAAPDRIFAFKFLEAMVVSSWAFLLLGSPLMAAYGITAAVPWTFYVLFLAFLIAFVLIPGSLGALAAIVVANIVPRRRKTVLACAGALAIGGFALVTWQVFKTPGDALTEDWLNSLLDRLSFCRNPILPSRWLSAGLIAAARGDHSGSLYYLMLTTSHAGLLYLVAAVAARDLYPRGYSRVQGGRSSRKRSSRSWLDSAVHRGFGFLPSPVRLLVVKDLRTFLRDPVQWSQFLIFFGLLSLYFLNIPRLGYNTDDPYWRSLLSFLNLAVTALLLSTFTSRFIFPLISLEGRNFWILGLLPLRRESILWGKFAFSAAISLVTTESLVLLSDIMLGMDVRVVLLHVATVAILCFGLSGISVGLGARLPNLKETDPSKIAAGFGGTLNLLVSLVFIFLVVGLSAIPHLEYAGRSAGELGAVVLSRARFDRWLASALALNALLGVVGTLLPLKVGIRAFRSMEF